MWIQCRTRKLQVVHRRLCGTQNARVGRAMFLLIVHPCLQILLPLACQQERTEW